MTTATPVRKAKTRSTKQTTAREKPRKKTAEELAAGNGRLASAAAARVQTVRLADVTACPFQPRRTFDEARLAELAESIKSYGILQRPVCRLVDGVPELIAGERRCRAAALAGLATIQVDLIDVDDQQAAELAIIENIQREDLSPIEEAEGYRAWLDATGGTQGQVANRLRLLKLPESIRGHLAEGRVTIGQARELVAYADLPATLEKIAATIAKEKDGSPLGEDYFEDVVCSALHATTRQIGEREWVNFDVGSITVEPTEAEREQLDLVTLPDLYREGETIEVTRNTKLFERIRARTIEQAKQAATKKKKGKAAPDAKVKAKPKGELTAAEKRAAAAAEKERRKKAERVLAERARVWRTDWLRVILAERLSRADGQHASLRIVLMLAVRGNLDSSRPAPLRAVATQLGTDATKRLQMYGALHASRLLDVLCEPAVTHSDVEELVLAAADACLVDEDGEPHSALFADDIETLAQYFQLDLEAEWASLVALWRTGAREGQRIGDLFAAHNKEQLAAYAKTCGAELGSGGKPSMIAALKEAPVDLPLPSVIAPIRQPGEKKGKRSRSGR